MSQFSPATCVSYTINLPSGDHLGLPEAFENVNRPAWAPSASATQTSGFPERAEAKTTRFPSGENSALMSNCVLDKAEREYTPFSIRHKSGSPTRVEYASRDPARETAGNPERAGAKSTT